MSFGFGICGVDVSGSATGAFVSTGTVVTRILVVDLCVFLRCVAVDRLLAV
jgi:hypothetical protein